jgi:hypothetical protein
MYWLSRDTAFGSAARDARFGVPGGVGVQMMQGAACVMDGFGASDAVGRSARGWVGTASDPAAGFVIWVHSHTSARSSIPNRLLRLLT